MPCNSSELCQIPCPTRPGLRDLLVEHLGIGDIRRDGGTLDLLRIDRADLELRCRIARNAKNEFAESKGSDAAITAIDNPRLFARRLGIEFALGVDVGRDIEDNYIMELLDREFTRRVCDLDALPAVDSVVWVNHGPVHYEDRRLVIGTESDMPRMEALPRTSRSARSFRVNESTDSRCALPDGPCGKQSISRRRVSCYG